MLRSLRKMTVIWAEDFQTRATTDILCWCILLQEKLEKKNGDYTEAKFGMMELLLDGQGQDILHEGKEDYNQNLGSFRYYNWHKSP